MSDVPLTTKGIDKFVKQVVKNEMLLDAIEKTIDNCKMEYELDEQQIIGCLMTLVHEHSFNYCSERFPEDE